MAWYLLDSERTVGILALPFAIIDYSEQIWLSSYKKIGLFTDIYAATYKRLLVATFHNP
jgi:hypothetical protein